MSDRVHGIRSPEGAASAMTTSTAITSSLADLAIEVPSWAYGNSGTRFKVFGSPGTPRSAEEKVADAATVHKFTGLAPSVALHIPWDLVDDFGKLARYAEDLGVALGTINSNTFQDDDYKLGSLTHADPAVRRKAVEHNLACIDVMNETGSERPEDLVGRRHELPRPGGHARPPGLAGRGPVRRSTRNWAMASGWCWSTSSSSRPLPHRRRRTGARRWSTSPRWATRRRSVSTPGITPPARTSSSSSPSCCDSGSSARSTSTAGSTHDDDLMVGAAADPFQLYRILVEVVRGGGYGPDSDVALMLDQCHNVEQKIPGQIRSLLNVQEMMTRALLLDTDALGAARNAGDVLWRTRSSWTPSTPTSDLIWRAGVRNAVCRRTRWLHTWPAATSSRSRPIVSAALRPDGVDMSNPTVSELIGRSNRLGSDPRNTNYAGGNTSAKATETDPVTNAPVELLWVKGSGGDLGTLTEGGLAVLRLDRLRALVEVYPGIDREDEMVAAFDYCLHGKGGAAPSIDTAMHGLVDAAHVDHLHPDSGIAIATAVDGEKLTELIFGSKVVWVPWRRPGFQLGLDIAAIKEQNPEAVGCILGGHGITAWGDTSEEAERNSLWIIDTAARYIEEHSVPEPFGPP